MQAIIKTEAQTSRVESNSSISQIFMSTTATAQLDYYINLLIKNCNFDCLNSGEREGERKEAKGMWLNKTMSEIYSTYDSRNCCQENFMNFDKTVSVCALCICVCVCLLARASKITIISGANTHTHIDRL